LRGKGISGNMGKCIEEMYDRIKFCVKCGEDEVIDFIEQGRRVRKGYGFSLYLFNIFMDDIIDYISKDNPHAPVTEMTAIEGLLFADDLAYSSFTVMLYRKQ
jgi:hypothetical protein